MSKATGSSGSSEPQASASLRMGLMQDRLGVHMRFAQAQVFRELTEAFSPFDITPLLFTILTVIEANPGCRQSDLGAALGIKQPNLVERIGALIARGLVARVPDPADRRANGLTLTAAGVALVEEVEVVDERITRGFVERLGARDHARLIELLKRLVPEPPR